MRLNNKRLARLDIKNDANLALPFAKLQLDNFYLKAATNSRAAVTLSLLFSSFWRSWPGFNDQPLDMNKKKKKPYIRL